MLRLGITAKAEAALRVCGQSPGEFEAPWRNTLRSPAALQGLQPGKWASSRSFQPGEHLKPVLAADAYPKLL